MIILGEIVNCKECNKIFNKISSEDLCHVCRKKDDELLKEVSRFIRRRKERIESVEIILENFDVTESQLYKWVREKKLHSANLKLKIDKCKMCEVKINYEGLCDDCSKEFNSNLNLFNTRKSLDSEKSNNKYYNK